MELNVFLNNSFLRFYFAQSYIKSKNISRIVNFVTDFMETELLSSVYTFEYIRAERRVPRDPRGPPSVRTASYLTPVAVNEIRNPSINFVFYQLISPHSHCHLTCFPAEPRRIHSAFIFITEQM